MKVIIPLARIENAYKRSKEYNPLLEVAGKALIGHLIEQVKSFKPEEIIFIVGDYEKEVITYVKKHCSVAFRFIMQKQMKGSAHAILGAKPYVKEDTLILFSDTLLHPDALQLPKKMIDGCIWVADVKDPRPLGVVFKDGLYASKLIEKPDEPVSNKAMAGLYYLKDAQQLFTAIEYLLENKIKTKGEYHLADALQILINKGAKIKTTAAKGWVDIDADEGLRCATTLLTTIYKKNSGKTKNSIIIEPCFIGKGAVITNSVIGPYVSIGEHARIQSSIVKESVIGKTSFINKATLTNSVIGEKAEVQGHYHKLTVADEGKSHIN